MSTFRCPDCDGEVVAFDVPEPLRQYAPDGDGAAGLCTRCLRVHPASAGDPFEWEPLPSGAAGAATALVLARLDSLALARADIEALVDHAERNGGDVFLALDRLAGLTREGALDPHLDLERRAAQLDSLLN